MVGDGASFTTHQTLLTKNSEGREQNGREGKEARVRAVLHHTRVRASLIPMLKPERRRHQGFSQSPPGHTLRTNETP